MNLMEQEFQFETTTVRYKFKAAEMDNKHLIVIFSGFGASGPVTYDLQGQSLANCRSNILWIKDEFEGNATYYICKNMDFRIENSVIALIESFLAELHLGRNQCTLLGASKGGSAALYFGIKYDFKNIIASVPQIKIGSYVNTNWEDTAQHMMGEITEHSRNYLDALLPSLLKSDGCAERNIYLFSSPEDIQYKNEIEPFLSYFGKYTNFNFIFTRSCLVWQHNMVTRYNLPMILSILYSHGEGAIPRFGRIMNGSVNIESTEKNNYLEKICQERKAIATIRKITFKENLFFPEGEAFIKGFPCDSYGKLRQNIYLEGKNGTYTFPLGTILDANLSAKYFDRYFCDYRAGAFASIKHAGIDFSLLPNGCYSFNVELKTNDIIVKKQLKTTYLLDQKNLVHSHEIRIFCSESGLKITKRSVIGEQAIDKVFRVEKKWNKNNLLHYEGVFAIKGIELKQWGDAVYYLILQSLTNVIAFQIGMNHRSKLNEEIGQDISCYEKAYFSTIGNTGVYLSNVSAGKYKVLISMSHKGSLFTEDTGDEVIIDA